MDYIPDTNLAKHLPDSFYRNVSWCVLLSFYLIYFCSLDLFTVPDQVSLVKEGWDLKLIDLNK